MVLVLLIIRYNGFLLIIFVASTAIDIFSEFCFGQQVIVPKTTSTPVGSSNANIMIGPFGRVRCSDFFGRRYITQAHIYYYLTYLPN